MRIGIHVPSTTPFGTPKLLARFARAAEERGFASLWVGEHVALFGAYESRYPYAEDGKLVLSPEIGALEPFLTLSYLAPLTRTIRLGTGICLVPQRNPVYTAKAVSTIDWLSQGRFDFGIGIGWSREEFEVLGVPWARRAERCREYVAVMRRLWTDRVSKHAGSFYELPACRQYPKPVQTPHPPIYFGRESDPALERVAELGSGWFGYNLAPAQADERIGRLSAQLDAHGRSAEEVDFTVGTHLLPVDAAGLDAYHRAGVQQLVLPAPNPPGDALVAKLDTLARELVEPAARL